MEELNVAYIQLCSTQNPAANLAQAMPMVEAAGREGAQLVVLPENCAFLGQDHEKIPYAQSLEDSKLLQPYRNAAQQFNMTICAGTIPELSPEPEKTYNTSVMIGPSGNLEQYYRKIHLFDIHLQDATSYQESASVSAGKNTCIAQVDNWKIGMTVCYDLRFPELYRSLRQQGAEILLIPAAFTLQTGKDHWEPLLRARAIENQCYVVAPNQWGHHFGQRFSWGKSMVIDPWGTIISQAEEGPGYALVKLKRKRIQEVRTAIPCWEHRRITP